MNSFFRPGDAGLGQRWAELSVSLLTCAGLDTREKTWESPSL
jgi:hypothetical protein